MNSETYIKKSQERLKEERQAGLLVILLGALLCLTIVGLIWVTVGFLMRQLS